MQTILEELSRGPRTMPELAAACGCQYTHRFSTDTSQVMRRLAMHHGYTIVNSGQGKWGRYVLISTPSMGLAGEEARARVRGTVRCARCHCYVAADNIVTHNAVYCSTCERTLANEEDVLLDLAAVS